MFTFWIPLQWSCLKAIRCLRLSLEACGAPLRLAVLVRRPLPRRYKLVHPGVLVGSRDRSSIPTPLPLRTFLYRLHVCNFHTGIFACIAERYIFINFSHCSARMFRFFHFSKVFFTIFFYFYHGDQTIWSSRTSWRICCIWRLTSIEYVQIQSGVNSDFGNGSF